ncbi:MAG TPA: o-succinylbenzoate synthase [Candidatus Acidoferrales bacterium]|nr:o-succinylbenzoate synthase [Candidatus Acidoferrales bacterium]
MDADPITVESIELREVSIPLTSPFVTRYGTEHSKRALLVILRKGELVAYGECVAGIGGSYSRETIASAREVIVRQLAPILLNRSLERPADFLEATEAIHGHNMAVATVEMALWDLQGKMEGVSISTLLAGVRGEIDACVTIGIQSSPGQLLDKLRDFIEQGYRAVNLKIKPGFDVDYVRAVRTHFPNVSLRTDANAAYRMEDPRLIQLDKFELSLIEQPLAQHDLNAHSKLQKKLSTPICLDESIQSPEDARKAIRMGACRVINVKPGRVGGINRSCEIHEFCVDHNVPVFCGGMLEAGIGRAFDVAVATLPGFTVPSDLSASRRYFTKDLIKNEFELTQDGKLTVPTGIGCGVAVDEPYLDSVTISSEILSRR